MKICHIFVMVAPSVEVLVCERLYCVATQNSQLFHSMAARSVEEVGTEFSGKPVLTPRQVSPAKATTPHAASLTIAEGDEEADDE